MKSTFPIPREQAWRDRLTTVVLYSIFFLTGSSVVLPGTLLPLLTRAWHMGDGAAGIFFLCCAVGSSCGALLAKGKLSQTLAAGCAMVGVGAALLGGNVSGIVLIVIALYGCGLGLAMTSISLLQSRRWPEHRVAELSKLNLIWALGAGCGPAVLLRCAVRFSTSAVLHVVSGIFFFFALVVLMTVPAIQRASERSGGWLSGLRAVPVVLLCLIPLATGIESGVSSWLSSYIMRGGYVLSVTITATTAFGAGLIASRLFHSRRSAEATSTRIILRLHPILIVAGIGLLMLSTSPVVSVAGAFLTGFGVGPMYPLMLALLLNHNEAGNAGFIAAGGGASLVPMITGAVSGWTHSLRTGLGVLLAAAVMVLTLCARMSAGGGVIEEIALNADQPAS